MNIGTKRLFFLGAGAISEAMTAGIIAAKLIPPEQITISNRKHTERLADLHTRYGVNPSLHMDSDIEQADIIIITVKPFDVLTALHELAPAVKPHHMLVSVVTGATTTVIEETLPVAIPVIRAMPNTSSVVQASATAITPGHYATPASIALVTELFQALGNCVVVDESLLPAVTGLSGTGPAYIYYLVEALLQAGLQCGLDKATCQELLVQTVYGAGKMLQVTGRDPTELRKQVTSPNGTTMAALEILDAAKVQEVVMKAVASATHRAVEMGEQITNTAHSQQIIEGKGTGR